MGRTDGRANGGHDGITVASVLRLLPLALIVAALAVASTSEDTAYLLGLIAGVCWLGVGAFYLQAQRANGTGASSRPRLLGVYFVAVGIFLIIAGVIRLT